jgi:hypothetical protein
MSWQRTNTRQRTSFCRAYRRISGKEICALHHLWSQLFGQKYNQLATATFYQTTFSTKGTHMNSIITWLKTHLTNSWMNSTSFLATMAHSGWSATILAIGILISMPGLPNLWVVSILSGAILLLWAAPKEFLYDANFELPKQTAADNWEDFFGYVGGVAIVWLVILVKWLVIR